MSELTDQQQFYLEWLTDPKRKGSKASWAEAHGLSASTLHRWEKLPAFADEQQVKTVEDLAAPERVYEVVASLQKAAKGGDANATNAANRYLAWLEKTKPQKQIVEDRQVRNLSDEELAEELGLALDSVQARLRTQPA